ncbi:hypothetical protein TNCV_3393001 [Trichonephila clavipes]|nr:hypothetical protein TNCV_3393001 [Trichonephila clavipes]
MIWLSFHPNFEGEHSGEGQGTCNLSSPSIIHTRGLAARRIFRLLPYRTATTNLQISIPSSGFEPRLSYTSVSVTNYYTGWVTYDINTIPFNLHFRKEYKAIYRSFSLCELFLFSFAGQSHCYVLIQVKYHGQ